MRERFLLPQVSEMRFMHELPLVELCNGLVADALDRGFERLELLAPDAGSPIAEIRAYSGKSGTPHFELPASMHHRVVRRFKAMARMRRPADTQGILRFARVRSKSLEIRVALSPRADGQTDVIMNLR